MTRPDERHAGQTNDGWSSPSLYRGGRQIYQPRTFTEADPMSQVLLLEWPEDEVAEPQWSTPTYVGPRRLLGRRTSTGRHRGGPVEAPIETPATAGAADDVEPGMEAAAAAVDDERDNRGLLAHSRTMAIASLTSRVTGFLRSSMLVAAIGVHQVGDAYNVANNFPNMVYELLLGGVLSSVLVPLLVHAQEDDADRGVAYTQRLLSIATAALALMTALAVASAPLLAGAFVANPQQRHLATLFAALLLPEIFFYGLGAMVMAVLNVRHSYAPGAWSPVLNNVVMIVTIAVFWALPGPATLTPSTITLPQILVLGIGTSLGIAAQALVLLPALRRTGFHWRWRFRAHPHEVGRMREVGALAGWVLVYVVASQIGVTVIAKVGVAHDAFTVFTNADLLLQMPYGILVVSLLTALMPRLSRAAAREDIPTVKDDLSLGARLSAVALVPITAGLIVLGPSLTVTLFAYGETTISGAALIGVALAASAFGLFPFAIVMLQLRVFYAMRDARTPTVINIFMVGVKVALVLLAAASLHSNRQVAVALTTATSASYVIGAVVGHINLSRRIGNLRFKEVLRTVVQIGVASVVGGLVALAVVMAAHRLAGTGHVGAVLGLVGGGIAGLAVMVVIAWRMRIPELQDVVRLAARR